MLTYQAQVWQQTGEDWREVGLKLSTAQARAAEILARRPSDCPLPIVPPALKPALFVCSCALVGMAARPTCTTQLSGWTGWLTGLAVPRFSAPVPLLSQPASMNAQLPQLQPLTLSIWEPPPQQPAPGTDQPYRK